MNIYENCPTYQNDKFLLRLCDLSDASDLLLTYSDDSAAKFFNGDNCHGDDFRYKTLSRMRQALEFWEEAYQKGWFVRLSIIDKQANRAVGTIEVFRRDADDYFSDCVLLRLDLRSDYEKASFVESILALVIDPFLNAFGCRMIATKAIEDAVQRCKALTKLGFVLSNEKLVGFDGTLYGDYYVLQKNN